MNTKKILLYGGGALVLGAVGFFVWSFFQKVDVPLAETKKTLVDENTSTEEATPTNSGNNPFKPFCQIWINLLRQRRDDSLPGRALGRIKKYHSKNRRCP